MKKPAPTNFAQAVSAVPTLIKEEHSNLILAVGTVEAITSEVEAIINIPDHGHFGLHLSQIDLGYKPTQARRIRRREKPALKGYGTGSSTCPANSGKL